MRIAIVEDLARDRNNLAEILSSFLQQHQLAGTLKQYESGELLLEDFSPQHFAIIFLDIIMQGMSGMDTARRIREQDCRTPLVFTTISRDYALEGYEVQALDYLVKPFSPKKVFAVMERVMEQQILPQYIEIKENRVQKRILLDEILYIDSQGHFMVIHTIDGLYRTYMTFQEIIQILPQEPRFQHCFRGIIVNLDQVKKLDKHVFLLTNGEQIPISRPKWGDMQQAFALYAFTKTRKRRFWKT